MPAPILHKGLRHTVGHLVHIVAIRGGCAGSYPATRRCCVLLFIYKVMPALLLHKGLSFTVDHLVHTHATRGVVLVFPTNRPAYRSAIYPQGMKSRYGLEARLINSTEICTGCGITYRMCGGAYDPP